MASYWRSGEDRMLERTVISRRTSEQEVDLLLLLEQDAPEEERARPVVLPDMAEETGEASDGEIATAISEWLGTIKDRMEGHDRFQLAVARNALGMIARSQAARIGIADPALSGALLDGEVDLSSPGLLAELRSAALAKLTADVPKYPALAVARKLWTGAD